MDYVQRFKINFVNLASQARFTKINYFSRVIDKTNNKLKFSFYMARQMPSALL